MLNEFKQQLYNVLSSKPNRLFVFSLSSSFLSLLGFDDYRFLCIRDLNRFPLIPSSSNIFRNVHNLFVIPTTPITIINPYDQLMKYFCLIFSIHRYLNVLNIKIQFLDIPILIHPAIKWIRYSLSYKNVILLVGYVFIHSFIHPFHSLLLVHCRQGRQQLPTGEFCGLAPSLGYTMPSAL